MLNRINARWNCRLFAPVAVPPTAATEPPIRYTEYNNSMKEIRLKFMFVPFLRKNCLLIGSREIIIWEL